MSAIDNFLHGMCIPPGAVERAESEREDVDARIRRIAEAVAIDLIDELISRGGLPAEAGPVLQAIQARNYAADQLQRFPHQGLPDAG